MIFNFKFQNGTSEKSEETVSRWANNHRQPPLEDLYKIAKFLDVDIKDFLYSTK